MIRTPRRPVKHCTCGTCRTCTDPLVVGLNEFRDTAGWATADLRGDRRDRFPVSVGSLAAGPKPYNAPRIAVWPSLAAFDQQMAALNEQVRGDG